MTTPGQHPKCSGGNRCVCDRDIEHDHCICGIPDCQCHTAAAYRMEQVEDRNGDPFYVPQGARLAVRKPAQA